MIKSVGLLLGSSAIVIAFCVVAPGIDLSGHSVYEATTWACLGLLALAATVLVASTRASWSSAALGCALFAALELLAISAYAYSHWRIWMGIGNLPHVVGSDLGHLREYTLVACATALAAVLVSTVWLVRTELQVTVREPRTTAVAAGAAAVIVAAAALVAEADPAGRGRAHAVLAFALIAAPWGAAILLRVLATPIVVAGGLAGAFVTAVIGSGTGGPVLADHPTLGYLILAGGCVLGALVPARLALDGVRNATTGP
jgi:hypothetical protein